MSRIWAIHKPALKNQYTITGPGRGDTADEIVFARRRPALGKTPFITVHDGPHAQSPIAAVSYLPPFAKHFQIGLGDPTTANAHATDMQWEELRMAHASGKKHTWAMDIASHGGDGRRRRIDLMWTRTRSVTVDGMTRTPLSTRNWKLTEMSGAGEKGGVVSGPILAVFTSTTQAGRCGSLQIKADYGREFDLMVWVTCLSLYSSGR